jgi:hypothetical protein
VVKKAGLRQVAVLIEGASGAENAFGQKLGRECRAGPGA